MNITASKSLKSIARSILFREWPEMDAEDRARVISYFDGVTAEYTRQNNFVIVMLKCSFPTPCIGISKRHPEDSQNLSAGVNIALARAVRMLIDTILRGGEHFFWPLTFPKE